MKVSLNTRFSSLVKTLSFMLVMACISAHTVAQSKEALRYEIDAKRAGISYTSKDALPRGREFKRLDSTYYVGWMLEGSYKYEHAADVLGFHAASTQLEKALYLLEKDFKKQIFTRTSDVMTYIDVMKYQRDWDFTIYALFQCYSNTDEVIKLWDLLQKGKKADLQLEVYSEAFNMMAWTVHRNRFYTSSKYPFLKNSIDENEKYANSLLDNSALKIKRDAALNKSIFTIDYEKEKMPGVWHYKSILFSYQQNIESASYYYGKLRSTPVFPENNYATFCLIQGKFEEAEKYYEFSKKNESEDKRMKESYYYSSIINVYKGENEKGIEELQNLIKANGSTPGFGWYHIALARNYLYNGDIKNAKNNALIAENFKEIHIGTTLGQSHYDFSVMLLNLMIKNKEIEFIKFQNSNWWYSPTTLSRLAKMYFEKYGLQFLLINQFSLNPERDRVIYKVFSTESTVSFDEIYQLIDGFSVNYFLHKFKEELKIDNRNNVKRYYQYYIAKLLIKKEKYQEAILFLEEVLKTKNLNSIYENLFIVRCKEALIICNQNLNKLYKPQSDLESIYGLYPQVLPFSAQTINIRLKANATNKLQREIISALDEYQIKWVNTQSSHIVLNLVFTKKGTFNIIQYSTSLDGKEIVAPHDISYTTAEEAAYKVSLGIFNIHDQKAKN